MSRLTAMPRPLTAHLVPLATLATLVVNGLAGAGLINDTSPGAVSAQYPTAITPAGYAFSIWSLIYLGLVAFSVYQWLPRSQENDLLPTMRRWFLLSCAANVGWIFSWHYGVIPLSMLLMLALLGTLVMLNRVAVDVRAGAQVWFVKVPFSLYLGWILVACTLNALITTGTLGLGFGASTPAGIVLLVLAAVTGGWASHALRTAALPLAMAWGIAAIAVEHSQNKPILWVSLAATAALVGVAALRRLHAAKVERPSS